MQLQYVMLSRLRHHFETRYTHSDISSVPVLFIQVEHFSLFAYIFCNTLPFLISSTYIHYLRTTYNALLHS